MWVNPRVVMNSSQNPLSVWASLSRSPPSPGPETPRPSGDLQRREHIAIYQDSK